MTPAEHQVVTNREVIEGKLRTIIEDSNALTMPNAFEVWLLLGLHFDGTLDSGAITDAMNHSHNLRLEGEPGDGGIDAWHHDLENNTLFLYQAYWPEDVNDTAGISKAREIKSAINYLESYGEGGERAGQAGTLLRDLLGTYQDMKSSSGKVVLRLASGGGISSQAKQEMNSGSDYGELEVAQESWDIARLLNFISTDDLSGESIDFNFYSNPGLYFPFEGDWSSVGRAYCTTVSGRSLAAALEEQGTRLVALNVRHSIGSGNKVNSSMLEALRDPDDVKKFWYGHNGINITCESLDINEEGNLIRLMNPQVVNGCQTIYTLSEFFRGDDDNHPPTEDFDIPVNTKVIEIVDDPDGQAVGWISFAANNQTAVRDADLMANHFLQVKLQARLKDHTPRWFYERKLNEWNSLGTGNHLYQVARPLKEPRYIGRDEYQQAWRSYKGDPSAALSKKNDVWDKSDQVLFERVFSEDRRLCDVILVVKLWKFWSKVLTVSRSDESKITHLNSGLEEQTLSYLRRSKMLTVAHAVAATGYAIEKVYGSVENYESDIVLRLADSFYYGKDINDTNWDQESWESSNGPVICGKLFKLIAKVIKESFHEMQIIDETTGVSINQQLKSPRAFQEIWKRKVDTAPDQPLRTYIPR